MSEGGLVSRIPQTGCLSLAVGTSTEFGDDDSEKSQLHVKEKKTVVTRWAEK